MTTTIYTLTLATGAGAVPSRATLLLEYKDPIRQIYRQGILTLDTGHPEGRWQIDVDTSGSGQAFYSAILDYDGGERAVRPPVPFAGTAATVGAQPAPGAVTVLPGVQDWGALSSIDVSVPGSSRRFTQAQPAAWSLPVAAAGAVDWSAVYTLADGTTQQRRAGVDTFGLLALPPPPPLPFTVDFAIAADDFAAFAVTDVAVRVTGPDGNVQTGTLTADNPGWSVDLVPSVSGSLWFSYEWTVTYGDGVAAWTAPARAGAGVQGIIIDDLGRILLDSCRIDFDVVQTVTATWRYGDAPRQVELSKLQPRWLLVPGKDYDRAVPLTVGLTYVLATGTVVFHGEAVPQGRFAVPFPFATRLARLYAPGLLGSRPALSRINLSVRSLEQAPDWTLSSPVQNIVLDATQPFWEISVAAVDPDRVALSYSGTGTLDGSDQQVVLRQAKSPFTLTPVGTDILILTAQISARAVFWDRYSRVEASLWTGSDSDKANFQTFAFNRNSPDAWWAYLATATTTTLSYRWSAVYYPTGGGEPQRKPAAPGSSATLSLPAVLS